MALPHEIQVTETITRIKALFGLTGLDIQDVVMQGFMARASCSPHHPRTYPGLAQWAETVRALRDKTVPQGWGTSDRKNFPLSIHPGKSLVIAVQTGDGDTGLTYGSPSNRAAKGATTEEAIAVNQRQLSLFEEAPLPDIEGGGDSIMWVLLYHVAPDEIRFELSLPSRIVGGKIRSWEERIVFEPIKLDQPIEIGDEDDNGQEFDISIERRASE